MSLRSEILGWVIRRLADIDAADDAARAALFESLRAEVAADGFAGADAATALPQLESAIARQDMHWLRETAGTPRRAEPPPAPKPVQAKPAKSWRWPSSLKLPSHPPGPTPPDATGPFTDHVYEFVDIDTPGGPAALNIGWAFDPACRLGAECPAIGFSFQTRAATFAHAVDHLAAVLALGGLQLPEKARDFDR